MELHSIDQLREWLELTNQQFDLFKSIYTLDSKKEYTTPKNIQKEYTNVSGKEIERSNLFTIIKLLMDKELIVKTERATYSINVEGIRKSIDSKDKKFKEQYDQFRKVREDLDAYLNDILEKPQKPTIRFLTHNELFLSLADDLKYAKEYYLNVRAPSLVCTPLFYSMLSRKEYFDMIKKRVLEDKDLKVKWLTDLDFTMQFGRAVKLFGDFDLAYKEIIYQINSLKTLVRDYDNLEFNYIEHQISLKLFMPVADRISECYIYLPGLSSVSQQGAIHIKSEEITGEILKIFNNDCLNATKLKPSNVNRVINKSKRILKEHIKEAKVREK